MLLSLSLSSASFNFIARWHPQLLRGQLPLVTTGEGDVKSSESGLCVTVVTNRAAVVQTEDLLNGVSLFFPGSFSAPAATEWLSFFRNQQTMDCGPDGMDIRRRHVLGMLTRDGIVKIIWL